METARLLRPTLGEQIEIEAMLEENVWHAIADPAQLTTALLNLAVNARDAMPNGGKLTLETGNVTLDDVYARRRSRCGRVLTVLIAVSDTGAAFRPSCSKRCSSRFTPQKRSARAPGSD